MINSDKLKRLAAEKAVTFIQPGMVLGLGEGSTAILALYKIADLLQTGQLKDIVGIPCSDHIEKTAMNLGIPLAKLNDHSSIDLTIDGADEVDPELNLIKGGGGALLREKMVAQISRREIIVVDDSKISDSLGEKWALPIEVVQFGWKSHFPFLEKLGGKPERRILETNQPFITDQGNYILDVDFGKISDPKSLEVDLNKRAGIVDNGLFIDLATDLIISSKEGLKHIKKE